MPSWSDEELAALAAIEPGDRSALAAFRQKFSGHSRGAVISKLDILRRRRVAEDFHRTAPDLGLRRRAPSKSASKAKAKKPAPTVVRVRQATPEEIMAAAIVLEGHDYGRR